MKSKKHLLICSVLASSMLFSSCIGSFKLFNNLKTWNEGVSNKFVNELIFIALSPVYSIAAVADLFVLNSIEFWTGKNVVSENQIQEIEGENGLYLVERRNDGYTLTNKDTQESLELVFNEETQTWSANTPEGVVELVKLNEDGTATVNMQNGTAMTVFPDMQGINAVRMAATQSFFAAR